jgi:bla regulator protein BlaR1
MLAWMLHAIVVSLLLGLTALALEHAARVQRKPTRWLWSAGMTASLLLPLVMPSALAQIAPLAHDVDPTIAERVIAFRHTANALSPAGWLPATTEAAAGFPDLDRLLQLGWAAASMILLAVILACSVQLRLRGRRWRPATMTGVPVHVSADVGPAIVGLWDPRIVVPRWLTQSDPEVQELVIAHEQSHLDAYDARLLTVALGLLVCMPWNLPLWWQMRRLRLAVEIDCDTRVLRRGYDVARYSRTLIAVGERQSAHIAAAAAMAERRSSLERRIRAMLLKPTRYGRAAALTLACVGAACAIGTAGLNAQTGDDTARSAPQVRADAATLDGYVGFYQLSVHSVFTITRNGEQLIARLTGQSPVPIFARSESEFSYKDKSVSFVIAPDGQATSLILHQYGVDMPMARIDGATAQRIVSLPTGRSARPQRELGALIILQ